MSKSHWWYKINVWIWKRYTFKLIWAFIYLSSTLFGNDQFSMHISNSKINEWYLSHLLKMVLRWGSWINNSIAYPILHNQRPMVYKWHRCCCCFVVLFFFFVKTYNTFGKRNQLFYFDMRSGPFVNQPKTSVNFNNTKMKVKGKINNYLIAIIIQ